VAAVVDSFGDPDASGVVDVDVGGVVEVWGGGPDGDFEIGWELEVGEVDEFWGEVRLPRGVLCKKGEGEEGENKSHEP